MLALALTTTLPALAQSSVPAKISGTFYAENCTKSNGSETFGFATFTGSVMSGGTYTIHLTQETFSMTRNLNETEKLQGLKSLVFSTETIGETRFEHTGGFISRILTLDDASNSFTIKHFGSYKIEAVQSFEDLLNNTEPMVFNFEAVQRGISLTSTTFTGSVVNCSLVRQN